MHSAKIFTRKLPLTYFRHTYVRKKTRSTICTSYYYSKTCTSRRYLHENVLICIKLTTCNYIRYTSMRTHAFRKGISTKNNSSDIFLWKPPTRRSLLPSIIGRPLSRRSPSANSVGGPLARRSPIPLQRVVRRRCVMIMLVSRGHGQ